MAEVAYAMCYRCGKINPVYHGPNGKEAMCKQCHRIYRVSDDDIKWVKDNQLFFIPKYTIVREV